MAKKRIKIPTDIVKASNGSAVYYREGDDYLTTRAGKVAMITNEVGLIEAVSYVRGYFKKSSKR